VGLEAGLGNKDDDAKRPRHLISPVFMEELARVLQAGATKYAPRNWEAGMPWHRYFSALMRHMWAWWKGENRDADGLHHLACAGFCVMVLVDYSFRGIGQDNRPEGYIKKG